MCECVGGGRAAGGAGRTWEATAKSERRVLATEARCSAVGATTTSVPALTVALFSPVTSAATSSALPLHFQFPPTKKRRFVAADIMRRPERAADEPARAARAARDIMLLNGASCPRPRRAEAESSGGSRTTRGGIQPCTYRPAGQ